MDSNILLAPKVRFSKNVTNAAKGIAVVLMLMHHLFSCSPELMERYGVTSLLIPLKGVDLISVVGKICVAIFVMLSGYGIALTFESRKGSIASYVGRRLWKLETGFWFVYVIAIATCFLRPDHLNVYFGEGKLKGIIYMAADALGMANFDGTPTYNETWWYMTLAILMVFLIPVLSMIYDKIGICLVGLAVMYQYFGYPHNVTTMYLLCMVLGIWLAKSNFLGIVKCLTETKARKAIFLIAMVVLFCGVSVVRYKWGYTYWADALLSLFLILFLFVLMDEMHAPMPICRFIGKHSMNMFLVHTLIFEYYFTDFIYMPKNWFLISILLVVTSLVVSIVIEALKTGLKKLIFKK